MNVPADGVEAFVLRVFILFSEATLSFVTAVEAILVPELTGPPVGDEPEEFLLGFAASEAGDGSAVVAVLACTFRTCIEDAGVLLAFLLLFVEAVIEVVVLAACLVVTVEADAAAAVEPGTIWRVGVAWRADGGRVAGVFGVGVCCRPERRPATSGSVVVFEVTMVEVTVMPEVGVTMELMTEVAEVAAAVVLDVLVELTGVELLVLPLVFVLTLEF